MYFSTQEKLYPSWAVYLRSVWRRKWHRIIAFWTVWILATIIVATAIATDYLKWDDLNRDFVSTNELSRAFLASVILVMDLLIVMQVCQNFFSSRLLIMDQSVSIEILDIYYFYG